MYRDILFQLSPKEWQEKHRKRHKKEKDMKTESAVNEGSTRPSPTAEQGECQESAAAPPWDSPRL